MVQDLSSASFAGISYSSPGLQPNFAPAEEATYSHTSLTIKTIVLFSTYSYKSCIRLVKKETQYAMPRV